MRSLDLVIEGGLVVDGTGAPSRLADVGVAGAQIVAVGDLAAAAAERLDASGKVVTPGFIDLHTHSDLSLLSDGRARSKVAQGVTTEVIGNCGLGPAPSSRGCEHALRDAVALIDLDPAVRWTWESFDDYLDALDELGKAVNVVALVAHIPLRIAAEATAGPASAEQRRHMCFELDTALEAGAAGISTGLMYPPALWADTTELSELAEIAARRERLFAFHMRDYANRLLPAVDEVIAVGRGSGVPLQISHLAVAGRRNWGAVEHALDRVDAALSDGVDVALDIYPYLAGSANLSQLLPPWAQAGGSDAIAARLDDAATRVRIADEWQATLHFDWEEIELSGGCDNSMLGMTLAAAAAVRGEAPHMLAQDVIRDSRNGATMVAYGRSEADLCAALTHQACIVGSDGFAIDPAGPTGDGLPHPRSFGTYPRLFARYVRERALLSLEHAVAMCTGMPAARLGLSDRGRIVPGAAADIVVLDAETVSDRATYREPLRFPVGIDAVLVNGVLVVEAGAQRDGRLPGKVLRAA